MKILVACEFSGKVRDAFIERGHKAFSCDLINGEGKYKDQHFKSDIREVIAARPSWDMIIAHPPCTYLANSGVKHLYNGMKKEGGINNNRWQKMCEAASFFRWLLTLPIPKIAIENPIMHGHAVDLIELKPTQIIQPWQFGHPETKATCLWLQNLPKLVPTKIVEGREARIHKMPPSKDRGRLRSITYDGIAQAMADQWG